MHHNGTNKWSWADLQNQTRKTLLSRSFCFGYKFMLFTSRNKSFGEVITRAKLPNLYLQPMTFIFCALHVLQCTTPEVVEKFQKYKY